MTTDGTRARVTLLAHRIASPTATGIARYYVELALALAANVANGEDDHAYAIAATREPEQPTWLPPGMPHVVVPGPRKLVAGTLAVLGRPRLDRFLARPDVVHTLHPWTATPTRAPLVTTVHDLMPIRHRDWYPRQESVMFGRGMAHTRAHAALVIANSEHTAAQLVERAGIERERIRVIHMAVSDRFRARPDDAGVREVCARYGVEAGRYLLHVGQVTTRKNLDVVLDAVARLDPALLGSPILLCVGPRGVGAEAIDARVARLGISDRVRFGGYAADADLPFLVHGAFALVHPSRDEGFGFTPIEAMASGVPVVASASGSLPEVVGDGGVLVDPSDVDGWAGAVDRLARDPGHRAALVARGDSRQERFRWDRVARDTAAVYDEVLTRASR